MANVSDELQQLKKRARRRLVGAITLVIFALIFLWTVLDGEPPKSLVDNHPVEIVSSAPALSSIVASAVMASAVSVIDMPVTEFVTPVDASKIAPVALPGKLINHQVVIASPEPVATEPPAPIVIKEAPTPKPVIAKPTPTKKPIEKVVVKTPEPKIIKNPQAILEGKLPSTAVSTEKKTYSIQVGAYADAEKAAELVAKLKGAGMRVTSEKINSSKGELTRVRVGPTEEEAKAKSWIKAMQEIGVSGTLIAKDVQ